MSVNVTPSTPGAVGPDFEELGRLMGVIAGDPRLQQLVAAWPRLPESVKQAVAGLAEPEV